MARRKSRIVGVVAAAAALVASAAATGAAPIQLNWTELAPRCNTVRVYAADHCGKLRYAPALRITWGALTLSGTSFTVEATLVNVGKNASVTVAAPVLCSFSGPHANPPTACSRPSQARHTLAAGATWKTTYHGTQTSLQKGDWLRFSTVMSAKSGSKTLWAYPWNTLHAYHYVPGGKSVFAPIGGSG